MYPHCHCWQNQARTNSIANSAASVENYYFRLEPERPCHFSWSQHRSRQVKIGTGILLVAGIPNTKQQLEQVVGHSMRLWRVGFKTRVSITVALNAPAHSCTVCAGLGASMSIATAHIDQKVAVMGIAVLWRHLFFWLGSWKRRHFFVCKVAPMIFCCLF